MSLLGFDAIGRLALGQLPTSAVISLPALTGFYTETGKPVSFSVSLIVNKGSFAENGFTTTFTNGAAALGTGHYSFTGIPVSINVGLTAAGYYVYSLSGTSIAYTRDFEAWFPRPFQKEIWTPKPQASIPVIPST